MRTPSTVRSLVLLHTAASTLMENPMLGAPPHPHGDQYAPRAAAGWDGVYGQRRHLPRTDDESARRAAEYATSRFTTWTRPRTSSPRRYRSLHRPAACFSEGVGSALRSCLTLFQKSTADYRTLARTTLNSCSMIRFDAWARTSTGMTSSSIIQIGIKYSGKGP
ncbi:hypothetical protein K438DRAFT_1760984 [Mycena galopus ATCC 62051]|nr:hypothetical protein K438DRAFT_1760984 [Mycena galopus ATCC 62051]